MTAWRMSIACWITYATNKHSLIICNTLWFSTAAMAARTSHNARLNVHCLFCLPYYVAHSANRPYTRRSSGGDYSSQIKIMTLYNEPNKFPSPKGNAHYYVEHARLRKSCTNEHSPSSQGDESRNSKPFIGPESF